MKNLVFLIAAMVFLAGCAALRTAQNPLATAFSTYDTNQDGVISSDEAQAAPSLAANFSRIDTDDSDGISADEYAAATSHIAPLSFSEVDLNNDGVISEREAAAMPVSLQDAYSTVDADGDANISPSEYAAARTNLFQAEDFAELDTDGDGVISEDEAQDYPPLSEAYDRVDANEDGLIDKREYAAAQR